MRRRSFLKTVAAAAPAAGLQNFLVTLARGQASALPSAVHVVGAGEDRSGHPHSLGFSSILFKVPTSETAGGLRHGEHAPPPGWAAAASPSLSGRMVLRDGGRSGLPGRRAEGPVACGGIGAGSPARAAHIFRCRRDARPLADRVLSCRQNGAVLPRC